MNVMDIKIRDNIKNHDRHDISSNNKPSFALEQHKGFRTKIDVMDDFGQVLFTTENRLVLGGALFTLDGFTWILYKFRRY